MLEPTLHCERNGWHPALQEVLDRVALISASRTDEEYRCLLIERADAQEVPGHLLGVVERAVAVLKVFEANELESAYRR